MRELSVVDRIGPKVAGVAAVLGQHIRVKPSEISRFCLAEHRPIIEDLATIVESVALADRTFLRRRSEGWSRHIRLSLPLYEPGEFTKPENYRMLLDVLWFLTGDQWEIEFVQRKGGLDSQPHLSLPITPPRFVVPFSNGLDSFSQARLLEAEFGQDAVLRVCSGAARRKLNPFNIPILHIPRRFGPGKRREQSYRSRPLVYFTFAAVASAVAGAEKVLVGESGQGAIGPALLPFANEWPFRSTHPAFLSRLGQFLQAVYGQSIQIEAAQVWRTKGEVLLDLKEKNLVLGIEGTRSCSLDVRHRQGFDGCGICGGCLLRTTALRSAGLPQSPTSVAASHTSPEPMWLDAANAPRPMSRNQRDIAAHSITSMRALAELVDSEDGRAAIAQEASILSPTAPEIAEQKLDRMLRRHVQEWADFVNDLEPTAWLHKWAA